MAVATYTKSGTKATTAAKLDKTVFNVDVKSHQLLKDAYLAYLANGRMNLAKVRTRGDVSGGGKKPWRQKGTGRARFGSSRNPIWEGGGVAFGPTGNENYARKLNTESRRQAIRQALSLANTEGRIKIIDDFESKDGKTKGALSLIRKIEATGSVLVVVDSQSQKNQRALSNLPGAKLVTARYLNVFDILNSDTLVITSKGLEAIQSWLGKASVKAAKAQESKK